jgi:two-component system sensor histidine kinase VicK
MPANTILVKKDGEKIAVGDSAAPIKNQSGRVIGCVIVFRDTTREREIDTAKNEFVSLASHQLRTPLTAINWYLEMLSSGDAGKINNEQKKYIKEIYNGSKRMVALVNALLNTSRIDLGTFAIEPELVDFKDIAESILLELAPDVTRKKMKIEKYYDKNLPKIKADPKLIRIIFQNLLSNAVKYTQEGGKIELKIDKDKKNINIEVSDNGYGIPAKQQEKIFSKLFRADNAREKETDGTGLGLYIIKSILEKTDGKIWFKSKENKGTSFYVTIPLIGMKRKEGIKGLS